MPSGQRRGLRSYYEVYESKSSWLLHVACPKVAPLVAQRALLETTVTAAAAAVKETIHLPSRLRTDIGRDGERSSKPPEQEKGSSHLGCLAGYVASSPPHWIETNSKLSTVDSIKYKLERSGMRRAESRGTGEECEAFLVAYILLGILVALAFLCVSEVVPRLAGERHTRRPASPSKQRAPN